MKIVGFICAVLLTLIAHLSVVGQSDISKGTLSTTTLVNVDVMHVLPAKHPNITVVFRAEKLDGEPIWDLKKEEVIVREDSLDCEIVALEPISRNRAISTGLVIDHSGSMAYDLSSLWDFIQLIRGKKDSVPSPLDNAKEASKLFVSSFDAEKDFVSVVGFGSKVDLEIPLSQDIAGVTEKIAAIELDGSTALYDGMIAGMKQLRKANGVKVLVAMTDGHENASESSWQDVVDYSLKQNIPIYIVGLGNVEQDTLRRMATETKGQFFYTKESATLVDIYEKISKQIQSYYAVEYVSPNAASAGKDRDIKISFDVKSIYLANNPDDPDVVAYLARMEFDRKVRYYGKMAVIVVAGTGSIFLIYKLRRRRRKKKQEGNQ